MGENIRCQSREDIKSSNYYPSRLTKKLPIPGYISTLASHTYDPPTFINNTLFNAANRPDAKTSLAFHFHLRMGCASQAVLRHTQQHVYGMQVQQGSWKKLKALLPCSACLAGKMRKANKTTAKDFTAIENLALSGQQQLKRKV
jgi:hypothetical protein